MKAFGEAGEVSMKEAEIANRNGCGCNESVEESEVVSTVAVLPMGNVGGSWTA